MFIQHLVLDISCGCHGPDHLDVSCESILTMYGEVNSVLTLM